MVRTNLPLVNAICTISYPENIQWDQTIAGRFFEKIKESFPKIDTKSTIVCEGVPEEGIEPKWNNVVITKFSNDQGIFDISLGDKEIKIRAIKPYREWEDYKQVIINSFTKLSEILQAESFSVEFFYENMIELEQSTLISVNQISRLFNIRPDLSGDLPREFADFLIGCEYKVEQINAGCRIVLTTMKFKPEQETKYSLVIWVISKERVQSENISNWIQVAHETIETYFHESITDILKSEYGILKEP